MEKETYQSSRIYTPLMAGLFVGYIITILNLVYDVLFRDVTNFPPHELINVSTIIFATLIVFCIAGLIYALVERFSSRSNIIYIILSAMLTLYCAYATMHTQRSNDPVINNQFHYLLVGIILITGVGTAFAIPYFVKHSDVFIGDYK